MGPPGANKNKDCLITISVRFDGQGPITPTEAQIKNLQLKEVAQEDGISNSHGGGQGGAG
jgi:hypothetical protein